MFNNEPRPPTAVYGSFSNTPTPPLTLVTGIKGTDDQDGQAQGHIRNVSDLGVSKNANISITH